MKNSNLYRVSDKYAIPFTVNVEILPAVDVVVVMGCVVDGASVGLAVVNTFGSRSEENFCTA